MKEAEEQKPKDYTEEHDRIINYLYKKHHRGWLGPGEQPADILQDIKTKLLIELPKYAKQKGGFMSWADVIVKNHLADKWRRDTSTKKRQSESATAVSYIDGVNYEFDEDYMTPGAMEQNAARKRAGVGLKHKGKGSKYDPQGAEYAKQMQEQDEENFNYWNPKGINFNDQGKKAKHDKWTDDYKLRRLPARNSRCCECCGYEKRVVDDDSLIKLPDWQGILKIDLDYMVEYEKEQSRYKLKSHKAHKANWDFLNKGYSDLLRELNIWFYNPEETTKKKPRGNSKHSVIQKAARGNIEANIILVDIKNGMMHGLNDRERHALKMLIHGYTIKEIGIYLGNHSHEATVRYLKKVIKKLINFVESVKNGQVNSYTVNEGVGDQLFGYDDTVTIKDVNGKNKTVTTYLVPKTDEPRETPASWRVKYTGLILYNVEQSGASYAKDIKRGIADFKVISENDYYIYAKSIQGGYVECFERYLLEEGKIKYDLI